mmetsp:Transcript_20786/g.51547  ORF Transcript_20786/g.51547 Transcript_20786/m.51547 type:complete len:388 (+) Transcript_20786:238-1401(+)
MPRRFRSFLKNKKRSSQRNSSRSQPQHQRYSSDSSGVEKYEYGIDYTSNNGTTRKKTSRGRWSLGENLPTRKGKVLPRSSRSLGDAEVKGRLISLLESGSFQGSEEEDYFEDTKHIERKFASSTIASSDEGTEEDHLDDNQTESTDGMQALDRACVRLDGIEVYAIVSALTCATAINCFDNYNPTPLSVIVQERAVFTLLSEMFYYLSGALGMMTGLHATLIFSLVTMYGRTALGIDRDDAFNDFFANTGPARFNGFWSFKLSLYCFMTQLSFLIAQKFFFEPLRPLVLLATGYLSYTNLYCDAEDVLRAAGVIYSTPAPPEEEEEEKKEEVDPGDRRASMMKLKRRGSMKKASNSLSTRNFGIDTSSRRSSFGFISTPQISTRDTG